MNIVLIGFMTSGKSTLGKVLAKNMQWKHVDLDNVCEEKTATKIFELFSQGGEANFRQLETYYLKKILEQENTIISTGGGVVMKEENRLLIKEKNFVVWLKTNPHQVLKYGGHNNKRPLLQNKTVGDIKDLLDYRMPFYDEASHFSIDVTKHNLTELIKLVGVAYDKFRLNP